MNYEIPQTQLRGINNNQGAHLKHLNSLAPWTPCTCGIDFIMIQLLYAKSRKVLDVFYDDNFATMICQDNVYDSQEQ